METSGPRRRCWWSTVDESVRYPSSREPFIIFFFQRYREKEEQVGRQWGRRRRKSLNTTYFKTWESLPWSGMDWKQCCGVRRDPYLIASSSRSAYRPVLDRQVCSRLNTSNHLNNKKEILNYFLPQFPAESSAMAWVDDGGWSLAKNGMNELLMTWPYHSSFFLFFLYSPSIFHFFFSSIYSCCFRWSLKNEKGGKKKKSAGAVFRAIQ